MPPTSPRLARPTFFGLRAVAASLAIVLAACRGPGRGDPDAGSVRTLEGEPAAPLAGPAGSLVLLVFLVDGCPIANAMSPEIARIGADATARGAEVWLVYPDPLVKGSEIERRHRDYAIDLPTLVDPGHSLVRATGATISPEAALLRLDGAGGFDLVYRGRINDLYERPGRRRPSARTHDLREALDAAFSGRRPDPDRTTAVGCLIEPVD